MIQTVLITGANGFIGRGLAQAFAVQGWRVKGAVRDNRHAGCDLARVEYMSVGDLASPMLDWTDAAAEADLVIHTAAVVHHRRDNVYQTNVSATNSLIAAAQAARVGQFIFLSTIKVNGEQTHGDQRFSGQDVPQPQGDYAQSKWQAEQLFHQLGGSMQWTILRLPLVYGAGVAGNFAKLVKWVESGVPLPFKGVENQRSLLYLGNLIDLVLMLAGQSSQSGQTFTLSDGQPVAIEILLAAIATAYGYRLRSWRVPMLNWGWLSRYWLIAQKLTGSLVVDDALLQQATGWQPPYTFEQALAEMVKLG